MKQIIYLIKVCISNLVVILDHGKIKAQGTSKELKDQFGQFYQLELFQLLEKNDNDIDACINWALSSIPSSGVISSTSTSVSLRVPQDQVERLNEFLEFVDREGFFRWTVKSSTIEDVFLSLCAAKKEEVELKSGPMIDYSTYCEMSYEKTEKKKALIAPDFKWVEDRLKHQFMVTLFHVRFIILNDSVITFVFFVLQFVVVFMAVPNAARSFGLEGTDVDLSGLAVFNMLLISPRFAMIMHDERVSGCLNLLKIDGMDTKMYWAAQLVAGFVFSLFTQPVPLINFLIFNLKVLDIFMPVFLLLGTVVALSISFFVSAIYKDKISTASVLLVLFLLSNITIYHPLVCLLPVWGMRYTLHQWNFGSNHWLWALLTFASSFFFIFLGIAIVEWRNVWKLMTRKKPELVTDSSATGVQVDHVDESVLKEFKETTANDTIRDEEAIRMVQVTKKYGKKVVVDNVTLRILQKESFGLLGQNGAGKSTILKMLSDQEWPTKGSIDVRQNATGGITMGVCQQQNIAWEFLTVRGNLNFISELFGVPEEHLEEWVDYVCSVSLITNSMLDKFPIELSGGMKRRLAIGMALAGNPCIVVLDEPTAGVDPKNKRMIWNALDTIRNDPERCMLITSHFMDEVEHLCDRIAILQKGVLSVLGTKEDLKAKFGNHLRFSILLENSNPESDFASIKTFIEKAVNTTVSMCDQSVRKVGIKYFHHCTFLLKTSEAGILLQQIHEMQEKFNFLEFAIGETSMEDVFRSVVHGTK
jgi:ABC-type multidrug transport system ATPase subunit